MNRMRLQLSLLVGVVSMLFVVGQVGGTSADDNVQSFGFFALVGSLVALVLLVRSFHRMPVTVVGGIVLALMVVTRAGAVATSDTVAVQSLGVAIIEIVLAIGALVLAQRVAVGLDEFDDAVANITLGDLTRIKSLHAAEDDIAIEMSRARRHERPLTVTVLSVDADGVEAPLHRIVQDVQKSMVQRYVMSGLARLAAQTTRRGDIVVQDAANNRVIILSPEASPEQVENLADRLRSTAHERLGLPVRYGSAGFPHNALTFTDLVDHAASMARHESFAPVAPRISGEVVSMNWIASGVEDSDGGAGNLQGVVTSPQHPDGDIHPVASSD